MMEKIRCSHFYSKKNVGRTDVDKLSFKYLEYYLWNLGIIFTLRQSGERKYFLYAQMCVKESALEFYACSIPVTDLRWFLFYRFSSNFYTLHKSLSEFTYCSRRLGKSVTKEPTCPLGSVHPRRGRWICIKQATWPSLSNANSTALSGSTACGYPRRSAQEITSGNSGV